MRWTELNCVNQWDELNWTVSANEMNWTELCRPMRSDFQTMNELVYGIRAVKLFAWEPFFLSRVEKQRAAELSSLKSRKYLDALCVYFWATTPVVISILTFTTYILLGHTLTAPKVRLQPSGPTQLPGSLCHSMGAFPMRFHYNILVLHFFQIIYLD